MDVTIVASAVAAVITVAAYAAVAVRPPTTTDWRVPALVLLAFGAWSAYTIVDGGLFGFLDEHVGAPWESQITMDLLIFATLAWALLQTRLRAAGIVPLRWAPLILCTGSIGMLLLVVRLLQIEASTTSPAADEPART